MLYVKKLVAVTDHELQAVGYRAQDLAMVASTLRVAPSFVVTSNAYEEVLRLNNLKYKIDYLLSHAQEYLQQTIVNVYTGARKAFFEAKLPAGFETELREHYELITAPLAIGELVAERERPSVRVILSTNRIDDPEDNSTIIQAVNGFDELLLAIKEGWALAYAPALLKARLKDKFSESKLKVALIIQVMDHQQASVEAYSSVAQDHNKVYTQSYFGLPDLRGTITRDYHAIGKHGLKIMTSEIAEQKEQLVFDEKKDIIINTFDEPKKSEKVVDRDIIEIGRQTRIIERSLTFPIKAFFASSQEETELLWMNRLPFDVMMEKSN